jgi:hypothetical protein
VWARAAPLTTAGVAAAACALVAVVPPDGADPYPTCSWLALTGWQCPGCGTLRAVHALSHADVVAAAGYNPLVVLLVPLVLAGWLAWLRSSWRGEPMPLRVPTWAGYATLVVLPVFWVARNLPWLDVLAA